LRIFKDWINKFVRVTSRCRENKLRYIHYYGIFITWAFNRAEKKLGPWTLQVYRRRGHAEADHPEEEEQRCWLLLLLLQSAVGTGLCRPVGADVGTPSHGMIPFQDKKKELKKGRKIN
jgi:hypothetical protein